MSTDVRFPQRLNTQTLVGLLIVLAGVLLMADNFGFGSARQLLSLWPVAVLAVGVTMFLRAADFPARVWAVMVAGAGAWLTVSRVFGVPLRLGMIYPMALVGIGAMIIHRAMGQRPVPAGESDQVIADFAFWSGVQRRVSSPLFRRADLTAVMGGIELDFRQAAINGDAVIDLFVVMGGIEIRVPPDWTVSNQMVAIMGGAQDKSTGTSDSRNRLVLRGFVMMGGVEVKA